MLETLKKALTSRTVWTLVFMVLANVLNLLSGVLSPETLTLVTTILGALAVYFRLNPKANI